MEPNQDLIQSVMIENNVENDSKVEEIQENDNNIYDNSNKSSQINLEKLENQDTKKTKQFYDTLGGDGENTVKNSQNKVNLEKNDPFYQENEEFNQNGDQVLLSEYFKNEGEENQMKIVQILASSEMQKTSRTGNRKKQKQQQQSCIDPSVTQQNPEENKSVVLNKDNNEQNSNSQHNKNNMSMMALNNNEFSQSLDNINNQKVEKKQSQTQNFQFGQNMKNKDQNKEIKSAALIKKSGITKQLPTDLNLSEVNNSEKDKSQSARKGDKEIIENQQNLIKGQKKYSQHSHSQSSQFNNISNNTVFNKSDQKIRQQPSSQSTDYNNSTFQTDSNIGQILEKHCNQKNNDDETISEILPMPKKQFNQFDDYEQNNEDLLLSSIGATYQQQIKEQIDEEQLLDEEDLNQQFNKKQQKEEKLVIENIDDVDKSKKKQSDQIDDYQQCMQDLCISTNRNKLNNSDQSKNNDSVFLDSQSDNQQLLNKQKINKQLNNNIETFQQKKQKNNTKQELQKVVQNNSDNIWEQQNSTEKLNIQEINDQNFYCNEDNQETQNLLDRKSLKINTNYKKSEDDNIKSESSIEIPSPIGQQEAYEKIQRDKCYKFLKNNVKKPKMINSGWLQIRQQGVISSFYTRYAVLTNDKLFLFLDEDRCRCTHVICFKVYKVMLELNTKENVLEFNLPQYKKKFELKINQKIQIWKQQIQTIINTVYIEGFDIQIKEFPRYYNEDLISEYEFRKMCETGDIILFETDNVGAILQRKITNSKYDHVGIVVKFSEYDIRIFDANCDTGVTLLGWDQFIDENDLYTKVCFRRLVYDEKNNIQPIILNFIGETIGKKYGCTLPKLMKKKSLKPEYIQNGMKNLQHQFDNDIESAQDEYFCSEIVAKFYKRLGILPKHISSCQYWPVSFTQQRNLNFLQGAKLGPDIIVVLNRHRNFNTSIFN